VVRRRHDVLRLERRTPTPAETGPGPNAADLETDIPDFADVALPVPGSARWGEWRFETTILEGRAIGEELNRLGGPELERLPADPAGRMRLFIERLREVDPGAVEYLDADRVGPATLTVRRRRPGDRLTPLGSPGRRKLKDYLISRHVPRSERDFVPIVAAGDPVLVVVGLGVDDGAALSDNTLRILRITTVRRTPRGKHDRES